MRVERDFEVLERQPGPCPDIETQRLHLRPVRMSDEDAIASSLNDFKVARMLSRLPFPYALEDATDWLNIVTAPDSPHWTLAITQPSDAVLIGVVTIELGKGGHHLGYWLNRYYWGRGFMSEAASGLIARFFQQMGDVTLHSDAFTENTASQKVQKKLGFKVTGLKDIYSISQGQMMPAITTALRPEYFQPYRF